MGRKYNDNNTVRRVNLENLFEGHDENLLRAA
jgi:hypothetical protein